MEGTDKAIGGEFVQKRRLRMLEKGLLGPGREEKWSWARD